MDLDKKNFQKRSSLERGHEQHGWLNSYHTFSFGDFFDANHVNFSVLRVINEDIIIGGAGFGLHPHKEMEIITYIISGALEHKDSLGNMRIIARDEVQIMSAGTGIQHAEYNHLKDKDTHFLQIWILPEKNGTVPKYGQKSFKENFLKKNFVLVVSKEGREGSLVINQDADIYIGRFNDTDEISFKVRSGRRVWIQMIHGFIEVNEIQMQPGDGLAILTEDLIEIVSKSNSEFILFDLI